MKFLTLLRHAKSSWDNPLLDDIERPLNDRGIKACHTIATAIIRFGLNVDAIFASPAHRAQETINRVLGAMPSPLKSSLITDERLYTFNGNALYRYVLSLPDEYNDVLLVGHNPAITELVNRLIEQTFDNIPTCGLVRISSTSDTWNNFAIGETKLSIYATPKTEKRETLLFPLL